MASTEVSAFCMDNLSRGSILACEIIEHILDAVTAHEYDKYLAAKELDYAVGVVLQDAEGIVNSRLPLLDVILDQHRPSEARPVRYNERDLRVLDDIGSWTLEAEPQPSLLDSWAQNAVPTRRPQPKVEPVQVVPVVGKENIRRQLVTSTDELSPPAEVSPSARTPQAQGATPASPSHKTAPKGDKQSGVGKSSVKSDTRSHLPPSGSSARMSRTVSEAPIDDAGRGVGRSGSSVKAKPPMDEKKKLALQAKAYAGKQITVDERGNAVIVSAPNPSKIPPIQVAVSALVEGAPTALGSSVIAALKSQAVAQLIAAPPEKAAIPKQAQFVRTQTDSAPQPSKTQDTSKYFHAQPGVQPSIVESLAAKPHSIAPGVTIMEPGGKTLAGPPAPAGLSLEEFEKTMKATRATPSFSAVARSAPLAPSMQQDQGRDRTGSRIEQAKSGRLPSSSQKAGSATKSILADIPDVVPRPVASVLKSAASMSLAGPRAVAQSPKPGSGLDFKAKAAMRRDVHEASPYAAGPSLLDSPIPHRVGSSSPPPRDEPVSVADKHRFHAVGDVTRRPRDRVTAIASTNPREHLPAPLYPAIGRFDALDRFSSKASVPTDEDMVVVDGSLHEDLSAFERDGQVLPARMNALTPSPSSSPRRSRSPSPVSRFDSGLPARKIGSWGETAARRTGGTVTVAPRAVRR